MKRVLSVSVEHFPIAGTFTISRGSKTEADVVAVALRDAAGNVGHGECVPYRRYGETIDGVVADIERMRTALEGGLDRMGLMAAMPPGAGRNAIDCALWDLEAKQSGVGVRSLLGLTHMGPLVTAYTLSLATPEAMAAQAARESHRPLLKVKLGSEGDEERLRAVAEAAPRSRLILDANEGWTAESCEAKLALAASLGVALVEQPLPAEHDDMLAAIERPVAVCADESLHVAADLERLVGRYDAVNIKLDKTGGLTEALALRDAARARGLSIMVGCMVGTSLGMAPAVLLAHEADFVDLDGPLILARDREPGLVYEGSLVYPPEPALWG